MKTAVTGMIFLVCAATSMVQGQTGAPPQRIQVAPPAANLNAILQQIQQTTSAASAHIGKLRIEKWKTDAEQRQQLLQVSDSLQKNIANAVPGLINDVQSSKGGVVASFKLYHNVNVLYEFLSSLADAAGSLGKKEEYEPLANDANALDSARQNLSAYIEQAGNRLESAVRTAAMQARQAAAAPTPSKVVVIDEDATPAKKKKSTRKKASSARPAASPSTATGAQNSGASAPAQTSSTPH
jgi:hypothetical protein